MDGNFAFALPLSMVGFGCGFLLLWRWGAPAALSWSLGFFFDAIAFSTLGLTAVLPGDFLTIFGDGAVLLAFLCYGQGLCQRMRITCPLWPRVAIAAVSMAASLWSVLIAHSLHGELLANNLGCVALIAIPLGYTPWRGRKLFDRILLGLTALEIADCLACAGSIFVTAPGAFGSFVSTDYAFLMQASGLVLSDVFALTGMAAMAYDLIARYRAEASTDPLSDLLNRRGFEEAVATCQPNRVAGSVVTCDIDHFKRVNDKFGHAAGDVVIKRLADIMAGALPDSGIAARFGGEEFVVYLPRCGVSTAKAFAELVRQRLAGTDWRNIGLDDPLTVSFGISGTLPTDFSLHESITRADKALYQAKREGRDRVVVGISLVRSDPATTPVFMAG